MPDTGVEVRYSVPVPISSAIWLLVLMVVVPALAWLGMAVFVPRVATGALLVLGGLMVLGLSVATGLWLGGSGAVSVGPTHLSASGAGYRFEVTLSDVLGESVQRLGSVDGLALRRRINGIGLPGYKVGWFTLFLAGRTHRAFLLVAGGPLLVIPLRTGDLVVLTCPLSHCGEMLRILRAQCTA